MKDYLSVEQVMDRLQISRATIHRWMNSGFLKYYKLGKKTLFKPEDVDALIIPESAIEKTSTKIRLTPAALAELKEDIALSDSEDSEGIVITLEQVERMIAERVAEKVAALQRTNKASA